jgi:transcriptional regulator with XRE-family HTH domain
MLGLSQQHVARACRMSRNRYGRIESGRCAAVTLVDLNRIAAVLGLEISVRAFPGGPAVRDAAQARKLQSLLQLVIRPLTYRLEVALPRSIDRLDLRAWDAMLFGSGTRTAFELEMRLRDIQALRRRLDLKRRDDPTDRFLLLVADTRSNRRVLAEFAALFDDLPRLRIASVRAALEGGEHPPTGILLV